MSQAGFISGLDLSEKFFRNCVKPLIDSNFPGTTYSAALIGDGSEVLGFDSAMSTDHDWGPRALLFLTPADHDRFAADMRSLLAQKLPPAFAGYPTSFTAPDQNDNGTQLLDANAGEGAVQHRIELHTLASFFHEQLGFDVAREIAAADWLTFPEQKLATIVAGRIFQDEVGLQAAQDRFTYYPNDVWLYLLAAAWNRIGQEDHLMGRAGYAGDELGSAIIAARLVRDIMRLCFLMERRYAPYAKWFGTAFTKLKSASVLLQVLPQVLAAQSWTERERHLVTAYEYVADLHNQLKITEPMPTEARSFFNRPFKVIGLHGFADAIAAKITDAAVKQLSSTRLIGSIDQISDNTDILSDPQWRPIMRRLYGQP